jgi:hypothetical protein
MDAGADEIAPDQGLSAAILPEYDIDLFGQPVEPAGQKIPRKNPRSLDYIAYLRKLPLPAGLKFHDLAPEPPKKRTPSHLESIWAIDRQGRFWRLLVDLRTGELHELEEVA